MNSWHFGECSQEERETLRHGRECDGHATLRHGVGHTHLHALGSVVRLERVEQDENIVYADSQDQEGDHLTV